MLVKSMFVEDIKVYVTKAGALVAVKYKTIAQLKKANGS
jgi:hypothetical protein